MARVLSPYEREWIAYIDSDGTIREGYTREGPTVGKISGGPTTFRARDANGYEVGRIEVSYSSPPFDNKTMTVYNSSGSRVGKVDMYGVVHNTEEHGSKVGSCDSDSARDWAAAAAYLLLLT